MNRKEWKEFCKADHKTAYFWYNKARKKLLSKEFESDERTDFSANTIHHLRDTEEQRKYNDEHYEMFGFEIDESGNEHFEYGKYVVFWTKEHHNEYHHCSKETRKKRSESLKGKYVGEKHPSYGKPSPRRGCKLSDDTKCKVRDSVNEYYKQEGSREKISKATREAMWRPDVRQRMLDGCKRRPPIAKEVRKRAAEANKAKPISDEERCILYKYFSNMAVTNSLCDIKLVSQIYCECPIHISWNTFQKMFSRFKNNLEVS